MTLPDPTEFIAARNSDPEYWRRKALFMWDTAKQVSDYDRIIELRRKGKEAWERYEQLRMDAKSERRG